MEREGSGIDKIYEVLLSHGRPAPELEGPDHVKITVRRRILKHRSSIFLIRLTRHTNSSSASEYPRPLLSTIPDREGTGGGRTSVH
jgi:predicted HTH transcriptional regulator